MRFLVSWLALTLLGFGLTGCGGASDSGDTSNLKIYRHSLDSAPTTLDPAQSSTVYTSFVVKNVFDTLYAYKYLARPYELKPNLAVAMPEVSADGLTYTIRIKQGVEFSDDAAFPGGLGREVTAEDFVYSIERNFNPATLSQSEWIWQGRIAGLDDWKAAGADYSRPVAGLQALDRYTIRIKLIKPYPQLVYTLAMPNSAIVPREAVEHYGREFAIHPVGSGPFTLDSFDTQKVVLSANPKFRKEPVDLAFEGYDEARQGHLGLEAIDGRAPPFIDRLEIDFVQETAARWNSFTKGDEIQYTAVPVEQIDQVVAAKHPEVVLKPEYAAKYFMNVGLEAGFIYWTFNWDDPDFGAGATPEQAERNQALRCAIRKASDWPARIDTFYYGLGQAFPGIIPQTVPEFDPDLSNESITRDLTGAKALLTQYGWTPENLPPIEYADIASVRSRQAYELFRGWMQELGYPPAKVAFKSYATFGDFNKAIKQRQLQFFGLGWGLDYPDAENTLQLFYGPNQSPGSNSSNYTNPEYDRLYEESSVMQRSPERTGIYRRMNQMIIDSCVTISGFSRTRIHLWHKDVIMLPDREILGGYFLRYVDLAPRAEGTMTAND